MKEYDEGYADGFAAGEDERHALRAENAKLLAEKDAWRGIQESITSIEALRAENARLKDDYEQSLEMCMNQALTLKRWSDENEKLREALRPFANKELGFQKWCDDGLIVPISVELGSLRKARAAMGESDE